MSLSISLFNLISFVTELIDKLMDELGDAPPLPPFMYVMMYL